MPSALKDSQKTLHGLRVRLAVLALFAVTTSVIVGIAYRYYSAQREAIEHEVRNQLLAVADLKVTEISDWRARMADEAHLLMADRASAGVMQQLAAGSANPLELAEVRTWIDNVCLRFHYAGAVLTDIHGNPVLSAGTFPGDAGQVRHAAEEVLGANEIVFHDLRAASPGGTIRMGLNLPLRTSSELPPFGALLLSIDPAERLYPLLKQWPVASKSGETLLLRRDGDEVLYLSDLRFRKGGALSLRLPIGRKNEPDVRAALGANGIVEGADYRGVPVIAAVRAVPNLPWFLVAKVDTEEVEAPIRRRGLLLLSAALSLLVAAGAAILLVWRRQQMQFYRGRHEDELEREALVGHYDYLSRFANDIILLLDGAGHILEANDRAVTAYGYSRGELLERTVEDLLHPSNSADFARQWQEVSGRGSMVLEAVHQSRDGKPFPVEISARLIRVGTIQFRQSIIRDISERKILDEKLRHTLDAHAAVIESSAAAIVTLTPDGRVASWNKAAERVFGWTSEEVLDRMPLFIPPDCRDNAARVHERAMRGEVISGMHGSGQCKDGRLITVSISAASMHDSEGRAAGVVLNFLDTTEQTKAKESLQRNEELFRATFEQAAVGMNYVSLDGRFLRVNPRYCELVGYSQEELLRLRYQDITYSDDLRGESKLVESLISGQRATTSYNKRYVRKDGSLVWHHLTTSMLRSESGEPLHFVAVVEDVTDRQQAEEALRQSEERFRCLVESAPQGILVERDCQIRYVNSAAVMLFGASCDSELLGRSVLDFTKPEDRDSVAERSALVMRREAVLPIERWFLRIDGKPFPVEVSAEPIEFDRQPASLVFLRDVAERKQAEAEKRRLEEQLLQGQKLESLGRLAGGVAHDFNNHLTVINGYCDMLLNVMEPGGSREEVEEIRAAGQRAGALTQQLLAFSRKQIAERKPIRLNEVVAESRNMLGRLIGENLEIVTSLEPALGLAVADYGQIGQVLMNLVINARDAMPAGGKVLIETANVNFDAKALLPSKDAAPGRYVMLSVTDTGSGMTEEILQNIFEPFFTTKGLGRGTGLGLSTVYGTVRQSGGWVHAESKLGRGSRFRVYLPTVDDAAQVAAPAALPNQIDARGVETVLLAEDQFEVRRLALRILEGSGYNVLEAAGGVEALELSRRHGGTIDLLVTDVIMPHMTGRELAIRLKESRPHLKVLYVSGYTADIIDREGVLDPGVDYLPKPFTPVQLGIKVREVLGKPEKAERILVLDDDEAVRGLLQHTLSDAGYQVLSARDGREGLRLVARDRVDLVLTDLVMPEQEGIETIRQLHRDYPSIRIVAMSGAVDSTYLRTAECLGAHVTLRKPIDSHNLLRTIRELLP